MKKLKMGVSAMMMIFLLSMFGIVASAEDPTEQSATIKNDGTVEKHRIHGEFQNNTNACAACHSTHEGANIKLVKKFEGSSEGQMCESCHDGTMGFYDVNEPSEAGVFNRSEDMSASMHNVYDEGVKINSAPGAYTNTNTNPLACSSCHAIHGSASDRLLKHYQVKDGTTVVEDYPINLTLNVIDNLNGVAITESKGPTEATDKVNYSKMCATCHDDYLASRGAGRPSNVGKPENEHLYTHTTTSDKGGRNCASCHFAHGTDVTLLVDSGGRTIDDLMVEGWTEENAKAYMKDYGEKGSQLKKFTNMSGCFSCHNKNAVPEDGQLNVRLP